MFGSNVLEVVIGLIFIYLLLSLFVSVVNEIITSFLSLRGSFLARVIIHFIDDKNNKLSDYFFDNLLFKKIRQPKRISWFGKIKYPSYLPREAFSKILLETIVQKESGSKTEVAEVTFTKIKKIVKENLQEGDTRQMLLSMINDVEQKEENVEKKLEKLRAEIEDWYDTLMKRASGWYKRRVQIFLFAIGLLTAVIFNADTFDIVNTLTSNPQVRQEMVELAEKYQAKVQDEELSEYYQKAITTQMDPNFVADLKKLSGKDSTDALKLYYNRLKMRNIMQEDLQPARNILGFDMITNLTIPPNRTGFWPVTGWFALKIAGWLLTALALSLGAPFWFDTLNKVMKLKSSGEVPK